MLQRLVTPILARFATLAIAAGLTAAAAVAQAPDKIRLGYSIALSGPYAPGATTTTLPNYKLWANDVNGAGGILLSKYNKRVPVELIEYDDRSQIEDSVRLVERLILNDKVDFVLAPWGTATNLAVAPVLNRHGYPHLAVTSVTEKIPELAARWPNVYWFLGLPSHAAQSLAAALKEQRAQGKIGNKVAVISVADQFGVELAQAALPALKESGFDVVYEKSYPLGVQDLAPQIKEIMRLEPDVFLAFSYPGDTMMLTEQAQVLGFNPKVFYTAVGTAFPSYKAKFGGKIDGVLGIGGWDPTLPESKAYFERHVKLLGREPDRWASPVTYASLQVLQQAIEKVGDIDRKAVIETIEREKFTTIIGPLQFKNRRRPEEFWVGQWQNGEFVGIAPAGLRGAQPMVLPKPKW